jgi:hypothetical protein
MCNDQITWKKLDWSAMCECKTISSDFIILIYVSWQYKMSAKESKSWFERGELIFGVDREMRGGIPNIVPVCYDCI